MKVLIDMNLSPSWCQVFEEAGHECIHWSQIGASNDPDQAIMLWAKDHCYLVFTHDLDFGALLAATGATGPSVIQLRSEDTRPGTMGELMLAALTKFASALEDGALVTVDPRRSKATLLPLARG